MNKEKTYCGFVLILGRSNVGKSTLLNKLIGQKISITSNKPQTTRHRIMGIKSKNNYQIIYIDTPGVHTKEKFPINKLMNRVTNNSIDNIQLIIFMVEGTNWIKDDNLVLNKIRNLSYPVLLVINKIDNIIDKTVLLPHIKFLNKQMNFLKIIPISAKKSIGIDIINNIVYKYIPEAKYYFPKEYITNCSQYFMTTEIIREKIMRFLGKEIPYLTIVKIEQFIINKYGNYKIYASILVQKNSQKKIIIGSKGDKIKKIRIESTIDLEKLFNNKITLNLWVKFKNKLNNNKYMLNNFKYINNFNKKKSFNY